MSGNLSFDDLKSGVKKGEIDTILACIVDMQGRLMGKRLVAQFFIDSGWKETLSKVAEAHPMSALANEMGTKSTKQIKTEQVMKKHKARQSAKSK